MDIKVLHIAIAPPSLFRLGDVSDCYYSSPAVGIVAQQACLLRFVGLPLRSKNTDFLTSHTEGGKKRS